MALIFGTNFNDNGTFQGSTFYPTLVGTIFADIIYGYGGNDIIDGGLGADTMYGGTGNDTYYIGNSGDLVIENAGEGLDTVYASISYTLTNNVEILFLAGTGAINGYGNSLSNRITGNSANNIIYGYGGNDRINGGAGADRMYGGTGDDDYYVDNTGDLVVENFNEGSDIVYASISYTLTNNVEDLVLTGTAHLNATGNSLDNVIVGNSGNNLIYGYGGNDTIFGLDGDDIIFAGSGGGYISGDGGNDSLYGGNDVDTIYGRAGDDLIVGNGGNDILSGGTGADQFLFTSLSDGIDTITDFDWNTDGDKILVDKLGFGSSDLNQFIYDSTTGDLFFLPTWDLDIKFAVIANTPSGFNPRADIILF
ncbi:calcium-binding protein [Anabaena cylindrica FACHB-243]|uniref:Hemolysin-type calcium-binding region n=2 Tax=Anabaena TaxID=1163 RepID=K9ZPQ8_ANACC|nr:MULTISPECIES: calcium-binding protein [Anabaena]AFZ60325.1 Hemolysin-type calcium-binding region [Anabaena cylindrica PCC 7122]MBD2418948.1 calcium-binding protein [Anabaena cylindrica FACHB-243]MBY5310913.1 calcium-binding protein [Anabaena sp. CCAP 1446/1C]MCM2404539.1 calcium-binding protein [Anabaena sp. CCAP 1446/1C]BAY02604.1 hypothetical protein NIES19_18500 [Anabaena cylindrica PCC 7122]